MLASSRPLVLPDSDAGLDEMSTNYSEATAAPTPRSRSVKENITPKPSLDDSNRVSVASTNSTESLSSNFCREEPQASRPKVVASNPTVGSSSPTTTAVNLNAAAVNLNAKTFCGSRRDRMRPAMRRKKSAPSLLQLGRLAGGTSRRGSDEDTCAPTRGEGGLWASRSTATSGYTVSESGKKKSSANANKNWSAALGGGMSLRLRGVDP